MVESKECAGTPEQTNFRFAPANNQKGAPKNGKRTFTETSMDANPDARPSAQKKAKMSENQK